MHYWAHSEANGAKHDLIEHLNQVAGLASSFAEPFRCEELVYWAGLWHDLGKFSKKFQDYLEAPSPKNRAAHSPAGMVWADGQGAFPLALLIAGHHGGLKGLAEYKASLKDRKADPLIREAISAADAAGLEMKLDKPFMEFLAGRMDSRDALSLEFLLRLLFSCLVDADYLDTESHFSPEKKAMRPVSDSIESLWQKMVREQEALAAHRDEGINAARDEIYMSCVKASGMPPGLFSLTVPTGGGKTLSGMAFALKHALEHGLQRVIVVLPYTSIIEQNVDVYRRVFGEDNVLEHHSGIYLDDDSEESGRGFGMRLAAENWDMPIIVTTTVQFFESLFSNKPSRMRKLHNIAKSVVILDEVQALPEKYLIPIQDALARLASSFGCSIALSSATQPSLGQESGGLLPGVREIVPDAGKYFSLLKRVEYEMPAESEAWSWERAACVMRESPQAIAVVNTKKDALSLLEALEDGDAMHLSTNMCGAHRREVLEKVRDRLCSGAPCRLVSTQVVEAGVDLDFPLALRAIGPLDRIVQAAGRCNREGRREKGRVVIFRPESGGMPPGSYKTGANEAEILLARATPDDMHDPAFYERYFRRLHGAVSLDPEGIQEMRKRLDFPDVADRFRVIGDDTVSVIVRYDRHGRKGKVERLIEGLRHGNNPRLALRSLQPYLVGIHRNRLAGYLREGLVEEVMPEVFIWQGVYNPVKGIDDRNMDPEKYCL